MKWTLPWLALGALACAPSAFLEVNVEAPPETSPPPFEALEVAVTAQVDGQALTKQVSFENGDQRLLPVSFFLEFPGNRERLPVTLELRGTANGAEVFRARGEARVGEEVTVTAEFCGDGVIQAERGEACDDANTTNGDGCDANCTLSACGNGVTDSSETCDDGNVIDDDGCDADCTGIDVVQISAGGAHTCALLDTGAVRCWGDGGSGRLGYGNQNDVGDDEFPFEAGDVNVGGKVVHIAAGGSHTCALLDTGAVRCWGLGIFGQLGYGIFIGSSAPPFQLGDINVGGEVIQISAGSFHTCALLDTGIVRCWGHSSSGQLGYGNENIIGDDEFPFEAGNVNLGGTVAQLDTKNGHTCALLLNGNIQCWGLGSLGQLGYGNTENIGDNETPLSAGNVDLDGTSLKIITGALHTCTLLQNGAVRCWGDNSFGQLGYGNVNTIGDNELPVTAGEVNVGGTVIQVAAGGSHTCALLETGTVRCWGSGLSGQLGYRNTANVGDDEPPADANNINIGSPVMQITAGSSHTCALLQTGAVRCWGDNSSGQLGYGNTNAIGDNEFPFEAGDVRILE